MNFLFRDKRITGLLVVMPANERLFVDDMREFNFPEARSLKLKEIMGYDKHRIVDKNTCSSDLAVYGIQQLFDRGLLDRDEIDALIVVTQSPDFFMPPTSNVIQGRLNLKQDIFCLDINQGCAGFIIGLFQAFMLLDQPSINKVILINVDVLSKKVSHRDRNSYPLIGDAASITVVERGGKAPIYANLKMDGKRHDALMIPAGGFRHPSNAETAILQDAGDNNMRAKDHLRMEGSEVFNFVQVEVPPMIERLLDFARVTDDQVDYYIFHQPNRFMLQKLADKMKVPYLKMPNNIVEHFGNSSGVTIPTVIAFDLKDQMKSNFLHLCIAGFGVGLTWASMYLLVGKLNFCELIDYP